MTLAATELEAERSDLIAMLDKNRYFLRHTTRDLTDEQARARTTVSELTRSPRRTGKRTWPRWQEHFRLLDDETLAGALAEYDQAAAATDEFVAVLPDLNAAQPLPSAPWFPPGEHWSARRVLMHIIAKTAQHVGHADIIRESIDGAKSMG
jgi:hypothetical protein